MALPLSSSAGSESFGKLRILLFVSFSFRNGGDGGDGVACFAEAHEDYPLGISLKLGNIPDREFDGLALAGSD